jgi:hypothetical protein
MAGREAIASPSDAFHVWEKSELWPFRTAPGTLEELLFLRVRREDDDEIVFVNPAEPVACLVVEKVAINGLAVQKIDPGLPGLPLALQAAQFLLQRRDLALVVFLRLQPAFAIDGVPDEIAANTSGNAVERKREQNGTEATTDNH